MKYIQNINLLVTFVKSIIRHQCGMGEWRNIASARAKTGQGGREGRSVMDDGRE